MTAVSYIPPPRRASSQEWSDRVNPRIQRQRHDSPDAVTGKRLTAHLPVHQDLAATLERVRRDTDLVARRERDPVRFVHAFQAPLDRELVGLSAACLAFGNVTTILRKQQELLDRLHGDPSAFARRPAALRRALSGFVHRVYRGEDLAGLLLGAATLQDRHGSMGAAFGTHFQTWGMLRPALSGFVRELRSGAPRRGQTELSLGARHLLPDPEANSACKRLALYLRWMVRPADGIDTGLWSAHLPSSALVVPLDTHIHRVSRNLGLTRRADASWTTAEPVRYDFALCHLGMSLQCPSKRDVGLCRGCGVRPVCRHWAAGAPGEAEESLRRP